MVLLRLLIAALLLAPLPLEALVPSVVNLGSQALTCGVQEQFLINAVVFAADQSVPSPTPTGTVFFTVNGSQVGPPFSIAAEILDPGYANGQGAVSFSVPGTYPLVAHYSGDSYYAPSTSTYSWPINVVTTPVRFGFQVVPTSLTFASGATTGNTDEVETVAINGFHGIEQIQANISEDANEAQALSPPSITLVPSIFPDGTSGFLLTIATTVPRTETAAKLPRSPGLTGLPMLALLLCAPSLAMRWRWRSFSAFLSCILLLGFTGCGGRSPGMSAPVTTIIVSSAGHYVVHLTGIGSDEITGEITLAQPTDINVTVQ
ncbi:MAG: Ig-like domain-containing protein [Acidobacteriaceae bacterium]